MLQTDGNNTYLLEALNLQGVEYLVVGGIAVQFYCPDRDADDLDLLLNPTQQNAKKTIAALRSARLNVKFGYEQLAKPRVQIPLKDLHYADIITPQEGFSFSDAYSRAHATLVNGVAVRVVSRQDLILLKSTEREKDVKDLQLLISSDA